MLILTRKAGEAIVIDDNITIRLIEIKGNQIKLGIEAPEDIIIHRQEVYSRILAENQKAAVQAKEDDLDVLSRVIRNI